VLIVSQQLINTLGFVQLCCIQHWSLGCWRLHSALKSQ